MRLLVFTATLDDRQLLIEVYVEPDSAACDVAQRLTPRFTWGPPFEAVLVHTEEQ